MALDLLRGRGRLLPGAAAAQASLHRRAVEEEARDLVRTMRPPLRKVSARRRGEAARQTAEDADGGFHWDIVAGCFSEPEGGCKKCVQHGKA